jgi:RHS repeat-associated protein
MCATTTLLATDSRNTPLAAVDPEGSNLLAYTPYGAQSAVKPVHNQLGFNGQLRERPTGWYHLGNGHRVYNPVLMHFHTPDTLSPFGKGGLNAYAYCVGDPVNLVDPTGQLPEWLAPTLTILTALGGAAFSASTLILPRIKPVTAPLQGRRLVASVMGVSGGVLGVAGAGLLLAGERDKAQVVSAVGALLNAPVAWMRLSALVRDKMQARSQALMKERQLAVSRIPIATAKQLNESFPPGRPFARQPSPTGSLSHGPATMQNRVRQESERPDSRALRGNVRQRFQSA